ncbi:DNA polymerase alpha/epsilon subunit B-domain-containing protein [Phakopsora pachyrhizi]|uniref:DNA polymerase alpha subunit B n=1 Tax=Phakopsora pachyrhizi TaxID=170000 RepID=A0AAV0BIF7_PHAPC|nr:DNA polymerase alpha/epsilon subunit B-domain-containing protein [Phakopsora pachyrhizi]
MEDVKPLVTESFLTSSFLNRPNPFQTVESFNSHLPRHERSDLPPRSLESRLSFEVISNRQSFKYKYMFEKLSDRSDVLDRQIEDASLILAERYGIEEWSDPSVVRQDDVWAVGRVCPEVQDSKITEQSCWLETSRLRGHGRRIWLKWDNDLKARGVEAGEAGIGLFPGAIIGVRGRNGGGNYFSVNEILSMPTSKTPKSAPEDLIKMSSSLNSLPISFSVACGPFTWDDDLEFLPFESLINQLTKEKPDLLILLGPFIDINHPFIKAGDIDKMPSEIFKEKITQKLKKMIEVIPNLRIVLIPSQRDLLISHSVYPQSGFDSTELGLNVKGIVCLTNPVIFKINELVVGISNVDVLMPLRKEEFFKPAVVMNEDQSDDSNSKDIISRACRHLLRQGSFYPLFPSAVGGGADLVNLDLIHHDLLDLRTNPVDILILPSSLTAFSKAIDSKVIANPRQLCKGKGIGTFLRFTIYPLDEENLKEINCIKDSNELQEVDHKICQRCRVDIVKI